MKKNILFIISLFIFFTLLIIYFIISINNSRVKFVNEKDNELEISIKYPSFKYRKLNKRIKYIINKYIDEIEISSDNHHNISILNIIFNKNEIENIGLMFRNDCFDMVVNIEDKDVILSNVKSNEEIKKYIKTLRKFYNVVETKITSELFDINDYSEDIIQIIPQEKKNKFEKNKFTILQIEV